ncbi:MAG: hypothetical protein CL609_11695 [Anaerolineaceae bacterium]|nr:hypothetical protein [Anaerolineaceae bacterium]
MIRRNLITLTILILAVATLIVLVINKPFESVTASVNGESTADVSPTVISTVTEEKISTVTENVNPGTSSIEPNIVEKEEPTDLVTVRDLLREKINGTLLKPGWVEIRKENISFLEVENAVVPETGQVIYEDYVLSHWVLVNEELGFDVVYTQGKNTNGEEYYSALLSNGKQWKEINSDQLNTLDFPFLVEMKFLDDLISLANSSGTNVDYLNEDGVRIVTVTSILQFPSPMPFNGWEEANMVKLETTHYYNWETGHLIRSEEWITRDDGSRMQANLRTLKVSQAEEISQDVIQNINNLGK